MRRYTLLRKRENAGSTEKNNYLDKYLAEVAFSVVHQNDQYLRILLGEHLLD